MRPLFVLLLLAGCPSPPNPVPIDGPVPAKADMARAPLYPNCTIPDGGALPGFADVCSGLVTKDNRACTRCPANHGCLDKVDMIYCIVGNDCTKDKACHADTGGSTSAAKPQLRVW